MKIRVHIFNKTLIIGDVHGKWSNLNEILKEIDKLEIPIKYIIQCGDLDLGFEDRQSFSKEVLDLKGKELYFCDGNHDRHDIFSKYKEDVTEVAENIFYCKRGSIVEIAEVKYMFIGGGFSIDYKWRTEGYDYFKNEELSEKESAFILRDDREFDVIISHECPSSFFDHNKELHYLLQKEKIHTKTGYHLDLILAAKKPKYWFFGHYHGTVHGCEGNTRWYLCDMIPFHRNLKGVPLEIDIIRIKNKSILM